MKVVLTHRTDVAVQALIYLAARPDVHASAAIIGGAIGVTAATVRQALNECQRAGVISSRPGRAGGYRLVASPDSLTIRHIVEALVGPIGRPECGADPTDDRADSSALDQVWSAARSAVSESLAATTLIAAAAGGHPVACVSFPADGDPPSSNGALGISLGA